MANSVQVLSQPEVGREQAADLLPEVYDELRRLAANLLNREPAGQTLQPTALVHEAYLRVIGVSDTPCWDNRGHFFAAAAKAMRRILVDAARRKRVFRKVVATRQANSEPDVVAAPILDLIALDQALEVLSAEDPIAARVVELKYFMGLSIEQITEAMEVTRYVVTQKWTYARSWLRVMLEGQSVKI